jgi:hypothetical protein
MALSNNPFPLLNQITGQIFTDSKAQTILAPVNSVHCLPDRSLNKFESLDVIWPVNDVRGVSWVRGPQHPHQPASSSLPQNPASGLSKETATEIDALDGVRRSLATRFA